MADDEPRLSYEELVAILKQSTALEARRGPATFSKQELLSAARELGIAEKAAAEVVEAHLARRASTEIAPRPFDTRIQLEVAPDTLSLTIPPLRPSGRTLGPIGFGAVWLSFVSFWTWGAAHASPLFAMFSLPFWAVGVGMLTRFGLPLVQRTRLTLSRDGGELATTPLGKRRRLKTSELRASIGEHSRYRQRDGERQPEPAVLLEHGVETFALLDGYSRQEQRWIESELKAWLANT